MSIKTFESKAHSAVTTLKPKGPVGVLEALWSDGHLTTSQYDTVQISAGQNDSSACRYLQAHNLVDTSTLMTAMARRWQIGEINLQTSAADETLSAGLDPDMCLKLGFLAWRQLGQTLIVTVADPNTAPQVIAYLNRPNLKIAIALADETVLRAEIARVFAISLTKKARLLCPAEHSCRDWAQHSKGWHGKLALVALATLIVLFPGSAMMLFLGWVLLTNTVTALFRLTAMVLTDRKITHDGATELARHRPLPIISLLLPVLREDKMLASLITAIDALNYPKEKLDVKLLLEEDDTVTRAALDRQGKPGWMEVLTIPHDMLRTKPRAMNYALGFCRGEIVGIYDAEDRPEPDQLRTVAHHLAAAPREVACVQAALDFYNPKQNWLTRCFTIEYAIWFRVLLSGVQRMGIPIPLGGTSVFFRTATLRDIGAWDAHNVTEDADLGMRLARYGYRCEMIESTTYEEANPVIRNWLRQRSRWLKGYAITWMTHMRAPSALWHELGPKGFWGFQILFLGALSTYLALPFFWLTVIAGQFGLITLYGTAVPQWMWQAFWVSLPAGQMVMISAAILALRRKGMLRLLPWLPSMLLYWPLGAVACYRAVAEVFTAPFYWHKTEHGLHTEPEDQNIKRAPAPVEKDILNQVDTAHAPSPPSQIAAQ